jgi:hypothetical protein
LAAVSLASLAWLLPAMLVVAQSIADTGYAGWDFFTDYTTYTRYLIVIWVMIATERYADGRIAMLIEQFRAANLLKQDDRHAFETMLDLADRRSSSFLAEVIIICAALVWSGLTAHYTVVLAGSGWAGTLLDGEVVLSWAGEAGRFVSNPLFLFLVLRWFWRFLVWTELLRRISRLPLQLMPLHPDRSAGLGFMAIYPGIFSGFIFALSCVVATAIMEELELVRQSPQTVWFFLAGWLVICLIIFLGPLLMFIRPLYTVRERALLDYGRLAHRHHLAFHQKWIRESTSGEEIMGSSDPSSASDLNESVRAVQEIRIFPVDRPAVVQLVMAAGVPLLAVVVTRMPFFDLIKWLLRTIL